MTTARVYEKKNTSNSKKKIQNSIRTLLSILTSSNTFLHHYGYTMYLLELVSI